MGYEEGTPRIPAAALTVEDAERLRRLDDLGQSIEIRLELEAETLPDALSHNVMAEITGSELPDEVVVMGGHYDSWDVGHGVHDDGAACIAAWHGLTLIRRLGLRPRRTLRVVLWTNEENGGAGGTAYREFVGDGIQQPGGGHRDGRRQRAAGGIRHRTSRGWLTGRRAMRRMPRPSPSCAPSGVFSPRSMPTR